mmetsp:Transcript_12450/g.34956  ORF Transcript_12450/g.34956 Transcript_12450/m.34956 type:complete len:112 (-) Transcript_12450:50-385(-)
MVEPQPVHQGWLHLFSTASAPAAAQATAACKGRGQGGGSQREREVTRPAGKLPLWARPRMASGQENVLTGSTIPSSVFTREGQSPIFPDPSNPPACDTTTPGRLRDSLPAC